MKRFLLLVFFVFPLALHAQMNIGRQNIQPVMPQWEQYEFQKYGKIGATLYTGTVNYSIPVYTYMDNDFEFPISISYATNGFRPNHKSGILGHGWTLTAGGMVTREIRGIPDELSLTAGIANGTTSCHTLYGYRYAKGRYDCFEVVPTINTATAVVPCGQRRAGNEIVYDETEPDVYTFNFNGHTGCFERRLDCDGNGFLVFNVDNGSMGLTVKDVENDYITMSDENGYTYSFTKATAVKKGNMGYACGDTDPSRLDDIVTGWNLTCIEAPDGRTIRLHFREIPCDYTYTVSSSYYECHITDAQGTVGIVDKKVSQQCSSYRLDSISFCGGTKAEFIYGQGPKELAIDYHGMTVSALGDFSRLSEIRITRNGKTMKTCRMEYMETDDLKGAANKVSFLESVFLSGEGSFRFSYNSTANVPKLGTGSIDGWGYYNASGKSADNFIRSINESHNTYEETYDAGIIKPNPEAASLGVLNKIVYPTGGYSELAYEPHDYSRMMERTACNSYIPTLKSMYGRAEAAGLRIRQIVTHVSDNAATDTVTYDYSDAEDKTLSSGIMLDTPRYGVEYRTQGEGSTKTVTYYNGQTKLFDCGYTHMEYAHVSERRTDAGSTEYFYTTSLQYPDYINEDDSEERFPVPTIVTYPFGDGMRTEMRYYSSPSYMLHYILSPVCSMQFMRGKLSRTDYRTGSGDLKKRDCTHYDFNAVCNDTVLFVTGEEARRFVFPRFNMEKAAASSVFFDGPSSMSTSESYTYNTHGQVKTVKTDNSDGTGNIVVNTYVGDSIPQDDVQRSIIENHVFGCLQESRTCHADSGGNTLVGATRYTYCLPDKSRPAMALPQKTEVLGADKVWRLRQAMSYDKLGNLTESTSADGTATAYLWSYGGQRLVADIVNCRAGTADSLLSSIGMGSAARLSAIAEPSDNMLRQLSKLQSLLPGAQATLYRYEPRHGLTALQHPNGLSTFFSYDGYGRLGEIRDNAGDVKSRYRYNTVTVKPLAVSLQPGSAHYLSGNDTFHAKADGGTGNYHYLWTVKDSSGKEIFRNDTSGENLTLDYSLQKYSIGTYTLTCTVTDSLSEEIATASYEILMQHLPVEFSGIVTDVDHSNGHGTVNAVVRTSARTVLRLSLRCQTTGTCTVTIDGKTYKYTGHKEDIVINQAVDVPHAVVSLEISGAVAESTAELTIEEASGLVTGCTLSLILDV